MKNDKTKIIGPKVGNMYWAFAHGKIGFNNLTAFKIISVDGNEATGFETDTFKKAKFEKNDNDEWWTENKEFKLDIDNSMLDHLESLFD